MRAHYQGVPGIRALLFLVAWFVAVPAGAIEIFQAEKTFAPELTVFHRKLLQFENLFGDDRLMVEHYFRQRLFLLKISTATSTEAVRGNLFSEEGERRVLTLYHFFQDPPAEAREMVLEVLRIFDDSYTRFFAMKFLQKKMGMAVTEIEKQIYSVPEANPNSATTNNAPGGVYPAARELKESFEKIEYQSRIQNTPVFKQLLTIKVKDLGLLSFVSLLNRQTGLDFFFRQSLRGSVTLDVRDSPLHEVLTTTLDPLGYDWRYLEGGQVEILVKK